jgi:hypothetical protein
MFICTTAQHKYCTNCTVCNWSVLTVITNKLLLHVHLHNSTAQILYKLYSVQLNCTYSKYTEGAATCSAVQQRSTFIVQILYEQNNLQPNCTYSNYTEAAATRSAAQQHTNCQADVFWSEVQPTVWNYIVTHIQRLDPSDSRYWLQAQSRNLKVIRNKWMLLWQPTDCTNWRPTQIISFSSADLCEDFLNHTELYSNELTVQLALGIRLLYCYCKCLIYIIMIMRRTAKFHNKQSISVTGSFR